MERSRKPVALARTPGLPPQPVVNITHDNTRVSAVLPTGESVEVLLHGATVISWKDATHKEKLWLSEGAKLDGSKAVRGGIPLVFPVFGTRPDHKETSKLPQHGFARTSAWDYLGKSTSETEGSSVKLDFGLSSESIPAASKALWPYTFGLIYSVTLNRESLTTSLVITNEGGEAFDCQMLLHTYLRVDDIDKTDITGLEGAEFIDKIDPPPTQTQAGAVTIAKEVDRVYTPVGGPSTPIIVNEAGEESFRIVRDKLPDVVVWNPWTDKAAGMADFEPKTGFRSMLCVEAGSVREWTRLEAGDVFEGSQTIIIG
ncbi:Glucose-6-phosphate 1-epimerase [Ceratocystis lukuohia]|uniref:Glucose-6-phosphate 1-epimerase n=2 Tax=Ceratocystis TaxID=5157 RepID=A0A0F8B1N0_CERFI|nr:Glucose-6-phosphate 1-epimerase [Ceratocystis platani]